MTDEDLRAASGRTRGRRYRERRGIPFVRWCPDCGTWNVIKPKQKARMPWLAFNRPSHGGRDRKPMPSRYCMKCKKKPSGPCLPPSRVVADRLREVREHTGWYSHPFRDEELRWLHHALRRARKREGIPEPVSPHECKTSDLDYFDGQRVFVRCKVCAAVHRAETGEKVKLLDSQRGLA